jgi:peptide/nickel transport system permease protein
MHFPTQRNLLAAAILLGGLLVCAALADFLAPYDPSQQFREFNFAPPARWHFSNGRPIVAPLQSTSSLPITYNEDLAHAQPLRFFVRGAPYYWLGFIPTNLHLFGVDEPARVFILGTDALGRDVFSRVLHGARLALATVAAALLLALPLALVLGSFAGFYGGWIDFVCMRLVELFLALPALYLVIALRSALPLHLPPLQVFAALVAVIALFGWAHLARIVRGAALALRQQDYVAAATALGASDTRIITHHLWPNLLGLVFTQAALAAPGFLLAEVTLSYLGLGLPEPLPSWGGMLASVGGVYQLSAYWWNLAPAAAIFVTSLAFTLLAEGLRQRNDPRAPHAIAIADDLQV